MRCDRHTLTRTGWALLALLILSSCSRDKASLPTPSPESDLALSFLDGSYKSFLTRHFPNALPYRVTQPTDLMVLLPDADAANGNTAQLVHDIVNRGHRVVIFGTHPFTKAFPWRPGVWRQDMDPSVWHPQNMLSKISDIPLWIPSAWDQKVHSAVNHILTNQVAFPLYHIRFNDVGQHAWIHHPTTSSIATEIEALHFVCRSPERGTPFILQVTTDQEKIYHTVIPALPKWQKFQLTPEAFTSPDTDAPLRSFQDVRTWAIGYDQQYLAVPTGSHAIEISPFFSAPAPLRPAKLNYPFPFTRGNEYFSATVDHLQSLPTPHWHTLHKPIPASPLLPSPSSLDAPWVFPLLQARTTDDTRVPLAHHVLYPEPGVGSWIWVGVDIEDLEPEALIKLMEHIESASRPTAALVSTHPASYSFAPLAPINVELGILNLQENPIPCRLQARLQTEDGSILNSITTDEFLLPPSADPIATNITLEGIAPLKANRTDYVVHLELQRSSGTRTPLDTKQFPILVLPKLPVVDSRLFLHPNASVFRVGRNAFQLHALDYQPSLRIPPDADWLSPEFFPAERIRKDLAPLKQVGINTLHIQCPSIDHPEQLLFLLHNIYRTGFLVIIQLPPLPVEPESAEKLKHFLTHLQIASAPQVIAIELGPLLPQSDQDIQAAWQTWCTEQCAGENYPPPSRYQLHHPESYSVPGLLHAFRNDLASRHLGYWQRQIKELNLPQMITTSVTLGRPGTLSWRDVSPYDLRAVTPHVDYLTLSVFNGLGNREDILAQRSLGLLARGLSGGKPLVWDKITCGLTLPAAQGMQDFQRDIHQWGLELTRMSHASGSVGYSFVDFYRQLNNPGLLHNPILSRPALEIYSQHSNQLRTRRPVPRPWKGERFSMNVRSDDLLDHAELLNSNVTASAALPQEIRHEHFKTQTASLRFNTILPDRPSPLQNVNAEWATVRRNEQVFPRRPGESLHIPTRSPIALNLINTGMPTWSASVKDLINTVWIEIRHDTLQPKYLRLGETPFGETQSVTWHPHGYGTFHLRPFLWATGGFGETLTIEILPESN